MRYDTERQPFVLVGGAYNITDYHNLYFMTWTRITLGKWIMITPYKSFISLAIKLTKLYISGMHNFFSIDKISLINTHACSMITY